MLPIPMFSADKKAADFIYFGFFSATNSLIKLDKDGNVLYALSPRVDANAARNNLSVDNDDNLYFLFEDTGDVEKLNKYSNTTLLSTFTITDSGLGPIHPNYLKIDNNNYYIVGRKISSNNLIFRKYTFANTLLFNLEIVQSVAANVREITTDKSNNIYITGDLSDNITTRKFNSSGSLIWSRNHGVSTNTIAVDLNNNVFVAGNVTNNITTRKYDSSGTLLWSVNDGASVADICVDRNGNLYTGFGRNNNLTTRKYNSNGDLLWQRDGLVTVRSIAVDKAGNVYTNNKLSTGNVIKYNSQGDLIWSVDLTSLLNTQNADLRSIDTFPPNSGQFLS